MVYRPATLADIDAVASLLNAAKSVLRARGVDQWQDASGYPDATDVRADVLAGVGRVLADDGGVAAYAALVLTGEPTYAHIDGAWGTNGAYAVVHRLAVAPDCHRRGVGAALLRALGEEAALPVRIDTHADNRAMQALLAGLGYVPCGVITSASGAPRLAYEKTL